MSNNLNKDKFDMSILSGSLRVAAVALSVEDRVVLSNALKHTNILETLNPQVRKHVDVLRELQNQYDGLEAKFFEERAALKAKYHKLYEPLYTKRYEIVNGVVEVEGVDEATPMNQNEDEEIENEKGVPNFWLIAMKTNEILAEKISERDEEALKYLKDIKWCKLVDRKGFKLEFFFDPNLFFKNSVLTKTYHLIDDDDLISEKAIGTNIEWYPGKCLMYKILNRKPKKGLKYAKLIIKTERCESFLNFFNPPQVSDDIAAKNLRNLMEQYYDIGLIIRDKIIPHAVSWFTGEAAEWDEFENIEGDDDDEDEDKDNEKDD